MSEPNLDLTEGPTELFPGRAVCRQHFIRTSISHTGGDIHPYADICPWCHWEKADQRIAELERVLTETGRLDSERIKSAAEGAARAAAEEGR